MTNEKLELIKDIIKREEKEFDFNDYITNYISDDDLLGVKNLEGLRELFEKANENYAITYTEIMYYSNAIAYLQENDASLNESLEIASEYGYDLKDLNSERLASLLASRNNQEDYNTFVDNVIEAIKQQEILD